MIEGDPVVPLLLGLSAILAGAKLGGHLATRLKQPPVLGELLFGVLLGNLGLVGLQLGQQLAADPVIDVLSRLGVILLLFEVGLESTVREMLKVGWASLLVAVLGVVTPFFLGWGASAWLLPNHSVYVHVFLGATLTATSVGITARVLQDIGKSQTREARVILGAAVIDDVLGLVVLAVVAGMITAADRGGTQSLGGVALILLKAVGFLFGAILIGQALSPRLFQRAARLKGSGVLLGTALVFCFLLSWTAAWVGLAPIVGAYAAGLVLEPVDVEAFTSRGERLKDSLAPLSAVLVPLFFVRMGLQVDLQVFRQSEVLGLAAALTVAAVLGKQACALGAGGGLNRLAVGFGMIPRGEVGLIFANIGLGLAVHGERIVDQGIFSAVVIMVMVTTLLAPPLLSWSLGRSST